MQFKGKVYYNLLRACQGSVPGCKDWEMLDYRALKEEELFSRLKKEGVALTPQSYRNSAEVSSSPEELAEMLVGGEGNEERREKVYLLLFELWRRLCSEQPSVSIFCDELDYQISCYGEKGENGEVVEQLLEQLENILDETQEEGVSSEEIFEIVASGCAEDLERFIYVYAADQIDCGNEVLASELIDGFYPYLREKCWLDFLRCRLVALVDPKEGTLMWQHLLDKLQEEPDLDLLSEMLYSLIYHEEVPLFYAVFELAETLLESEEDFQVLLQIVGEYFSVLDKEEEEKKILAILAKRSFFQKDRQLSIDDGDLQEVKKVLSLSS